MSTIEDYIRGFASGSACSGAGSAGQANQHMNLTKAAPAIPRAMEAQAFAIKRLIESAHELQSRLGPMLSAEPPSPLGENGQASAASECGLSEQINSNTAEMTQAANVLRSILRRLAL